MFYRGEKAEDVTTHRVLRHAVNYAGLDHRMAEDPAQRELSLTEDGYSRCFKVPVSGADLLARSALIEAATRAGKTLVALIKEIGGDALFSRLAIADTLDEPYADRIRDVYENYSDNDLAVCVGRGQGPDGRRRPERQKQVGLIEERADPTHDECWRPP